MTVEETEEQTDEVDASVTVGEVSSDEDETDEEVEPEPVDDTSPDDKIYLYRVPVEVEGNTITSVYDVKSGGNGYLTYYGVNQHVVITDKAVPHLHKDEVNVKVEELTRGEVEASDDLVRDFV